MSSNESNSSKSRNGNKLNKNIEKMLKKAENDKLIKSYKAEPRYNYPGYTKKQFSPDFEITLMDNSKIVIDNTTSARHDRFKQKQWDANGIKAYFEEKDIEINYYIVLPNDDELGGDDTREKEIENYQREKDKIANGKYFSAVDDIIQVNDLIRIIKEADE